MKKIHLICTLILVAHTYCLKSATAAVESAIPSGTQHPAAMNLTSFSGSPDLFNSMPTDNSLYKSDGEVDLSKVTGSVEEVTSDVGIQKEIREFKLQEIAAIQKTITTLENMLLQTEKELASAKGDSSPLLVKWAKIKSALDGERQVIAAIKGMPEDMSDPVAELTYGYTQAQETIKLLTKDKSVIKEEVSRALENCQEYIKKKSPADKENRAKAFKDGRDQLAAYYELAVSLYDDFLRMLDGLWLVSAQGFVKQKNNEIACITKRETFKDYSDANLSSLVGYELRLALEMKVSALAAKRDSSADAVIKKYRTQQSAIWQNGGAVVGKRELIEQRKADWQAAQEAEKEVRSVKGAVNERLIQSAVSVTNQAWEAYIKDQGRYDLEQVISQARELLRGIIIQIRAVDENELDAGPSQVGVRVLMHEAGIFNQAKYLGDKALGSSFFSHIATGLSKHISLFKEMKPVSSEFEMRLRAVARMYPGVAVALPTVRWLANKYAPGLIDVWA